MSSTERRRNPRYVTDTPVTIHRNDEKIPARMVDINEGGIGVIAEKGVFPGTRVKIKVRYVDKFVIDGTVRWADPIGAADPTLYRIGIEADSIMLQPKGSGTTPPDRSEFVRKCLSETGS